MQYHEPHQEYLVEEMRVLARRAYGPKRPDDEPVVHHLVNIDRIAKLHAIAHNPYHQLVFGHLSTVEMMRKCAVMMAENLDYHRAGRLLKDIDRIEARQAKEAKEARAQASEPDRLPPQARPAATDIFVLDLEAQPVVPPPLTEEQVYLRSLSDRELARQFKAAQKRRNIEARAAERIEPPTTSRDTVLRTLFPEPPTGAESG